MSIEIPDRPPPAPPGSGESLSDSDSFRSTASSSMKLCQSTPHVSKSTISSHNMDVDDFVSIVNTNSHIIEPAEETIRRSLPPDTANLSQHHRSAMRADAAETQAIQWQLMAVSVAKKLKHSNEKVETLKALLRDIDNQLSKKTKSETDLFEMEEPINNINDNFDHLLQKIKHLSTSPPVNHTLLSRKKSKRRSDDLDTDLPRKHTMSSSPSSPSSLLANDRLQKRKTRIRKGSHSPRSMGSNKKFSSSRRGSPVGSSPRELDETTMVDSVKSEPESLTSSQRKRLSLDTIERKPQDFDPQLSPSTRHRIASALRKSPLRQSPERAETDTKSRLGWLSRLAPGSTSMSNMTLLSSSSVPSSRSAKALQRDKFRLDLTRDPVILHEELGHGPVSTVYRACVSGFTVAVKSYRVQYANSDERARLRATLQLLTTLSHPNVVVHLGTAFERESGFYFLYMEYYCHTLRQELDEKRKNNVVENVSSMAIEMCETLCQIAQAIAYIHGRHVMHRDIKSENCFVIIDTVGMSKSFNSTSKSMKRYVLGDFGECRELNTNLFEPNVGTPEFMAPEMVSTSAQYISYDEKVDIWSFGMLVYELVSLDIPYHSSGIDRFKLPQLVQEGVRPKFPDHINLADYQSFVQLYHQCTERVSHKRPNSSDLVKILQRASSLFDLKRGINDLHSAPVRHRSHSVFALDDAGEDLLEE